MSYELRAMTLPAGRLQSARCLLQAFINKSAARCEVALRMGRVCLDTFTGAEYDLTARPGRLKAIKNKLRAMSYELRARKLQLRELKAHSLPAGRQAHSSQLTILSYNSCAIIFCHV